MRLRVVILVLMQFIGYCRCVYAQSAADTACIYFNRGYSSLDLSLRDNRQTLDNFIGQLNALCSDTLCNGVTLIVEGNASPDGGFNANLRLSKNRVKNVLEYIRLHTTLPDSLIRVDADGIDWDGLAERVAKDDRMPGHERALDILHNTPVWIFGEQGQIIDSRKKQLMDLEGGRTYRYMAEHYFPELRNTVLRLSYTVEQADLPAVEEPNADKDTMPVPDLKAEQKQCTKPSEDENPGDTIIDKDSVMRHDMPFDPVDGELRPVEIEPLHRLALKTNLLYDAILMPSLEIEYRINDRWSVNLEGEVAWWSRKSQHKYYQIATIGPEGRYWFRTKKPWHGHYVGAFAAGSWYDLENGDRGYKGEFFMTGFSYGYMFPIGRALSLEAGIGIGFLHTVYEEYLPIDGHYVYQQTSRTNYFGPVKLKLALAWRLWDINRKKGGVR